MRGDPLTSEIGVRQNSVLAFVGKSKNGSHSCYSSGETSSEGAGTYTDKGGERRVLSGYTIPKLGGPASSGYAFTSSQVQHKVMDTCNLTNQDFTTGSQQTNASTRPKVHHSHTNQSHLDLTGSQQAQTPVYASTRSKVHHTVHSHTNQSHLDLTGSQTPVYASTRSKVHHTVHSHTNQSHLDLTGSQTPVYASTRSKVHHTINSHDSIGRQLDHTHTTMIELRSKTNSNFDVCSQVSSTPFSATNTPTQSTVVQVQDGVSSNTQDSNSLPGHIATRSRSEIPRDPCLPVVHDSPVLPHSNGRSASNSKSIIKKTLDKYFDRGEITNRQYKRILERANQKVQKGIDQSSYMNEKRVVKLVGDYVKAYMYHEPDEGAC